MKRNRHVLSGFEVSRTNGFREFNGSRIGLVANHTSVGADLLPSFYHLISSSDLKLVRLFSPEHGLWGTAQDQEQVKTERDPRTGLEIVSLYGQQLAPSEEMIADCDLIVFDIQDIGVRYYTFVYTMLLTMKVCAAASKPFMVLDRPNPLGGLKREGNLLEPAFRSFVGLYPLPVVHGLTVAELALFINETEQIRCQLQVVPCQGWHRDMLYEQTGLTWVPPSPNMPALTTAHVYAGSCLFEATNVSEGRGTTLPFELIGAPWIDPFEWLEALNYYRLEGVRFRPLYFRPLTNKHAGLTCGGLQIHVLDRPNFQAYLTGIVMLKTLFALYPKRCAWKQPPYEFEQHKLPIDILCGNEAIRLWIEQGQFLSELSSTWPDQVRSFENRIAPFLLYS
ncbi:DUF1343 domain-containing protein [bacterium]|nr:DUF1343 domain-containing protein [bacterium]